jgi:hypothetical protein
LTTLISLKEQEQGHAYTILSRGPKYKKKKEFNELFVWANPPLHSRYAIIDHIFLT